MSLRYIDTHAHMNLSAFDADREEVLLRAKSAGVGLINVGTKFSTSVKAVEIANANDDVYAIVGLHPVQTTAGHHDEDETGEGGKPFTSKGEIFDFESFKTLALEPKVVAIGECGLDYFHTTSETIGAQKNAFIEQIHLANEIQKPLMLHIRNGKDTSMNAYRDVWEILKSECKVRGNAHFFSGSVEDAKMFLDIGFSVSFTGVVTFTRDYDEVVRYIPDDMIHAETDAPYVAPIPHRGSRNEPAYVIEVVKKLALIRGVEEENFHEKLLENARTLYKL